MKILFILWESWSGKTTLERYLIENYWFRTFDKLSSRPPRDDDSWYIHFPAKEITDMYVDWIVHECIKYDGHMYAMRIPSDAKEDDCFVAVVTPSWYHQFIDIWIDDKHSVYSIFMTNSRADEWMWNRWDSKESIRRRSILNKKLVRYSWAFDIIDWSRWAEAITELLKLMYPKLLCQKS